MKIVTTMLENWKAMMHRGFGINGDVYISWAAWYYFEQGEETCRRARLEYPGVEKQNFYIPAFPLCSDIPPYKQLQLNL